MIEKYNLDARIQANFPLPLDQSTLLVLAYTGSISHGTTDLVNPGIDDVDLMGAVIPPIPYLLGLQTFEQWDPPPNVNGPLGELDVTIYDIRKLVRLWLKSNPNVLGLLWLPETAYTVCHSWFNSFFAIRQAFSSKQGYQPLRGYALGQMKDIDKAVYRGYMGAKRKELVDRFGYDTKHAAHTIRILRTGIEYLQTGEYHVWRGDRDAAELKAIKRGEWSRDHIIAEATQLIAWLDDVYQHSPLPDEPDRVLVEETLITLLTAFMTHHFQRWKDEHKPAWPTYFDLPLRRTDG